MKKRFALSVALIATLSVVGTPAVLAQDEAAEEAAPAEGSGPPPMPSMADFGAVDVQEDVAGQSIEEWAHEMALWMNGSKDHAVISTGDCTVGQDGPVFFLQNTWLGEVLVLDCTIPADTYILASPGGGFGFNTEPEETAEDLDDMGRMFSQWFSDPEIVLDGKHVPVGPSSWIHREPFDFTIPENNVWDYPPGDTLAGYAGWYVMLEALAPGEHTIILADDSSEPARIEDGEAIYSTGTAYAVYRITVEADVAEADVAEADAAEADVAEADAAEADAAE